ncbi:MAG: hypothetical protein FI729_03280 [SAR202 cluster bacterium]|nr:hypothetical protein [SAR202 cluster bacterium]|tara:strand:+ start:347 stop:526 length:180 start_codon:yes stop_codon:yes gene_type:complete
MANFCYDCCLELFSGSEEEAMENDFAGIVRNNEKYFCLCEGCGWITVDKNGKKINETDE